MRMGYLPHLITDLALILGAAAISTLINYSLTHENTVVGKSIRESGLREKAGALMVGIERNGERMLNPESELVLLQAGDILFIVANRRKLRYFLSHY